jgi:hypothetical protein
MSNAIIHAFLLFILIISIPTRASAQNNGTTGTPPPNSKNTFSLQTDVVVLIVFAVVIFSGIVLTIYLSCRGRSRTITVEDIESNRSYDYGSTFVTTENSPQIVKAFILRTIQLIKNEHHARTQMVCTRCLYPFIPTIDGINGQRSSTYNCNHRYHSACFSQNCVVDVCVDPSLRDPELIRRRPGFSTPPSLQIIPSTFEKTYHLPPRNNNVPMFNQIQDRERLTWHKLNTLYGIYSNYIVIEAVVTVISETATTWEINVDTSRLDELISSSNH